MGSRFFRLFGMVGLLLACFCFAQAQTQKASDSSPDRLKITASYLNTEFHLNPLESLEYLKGVSIDADGRIFSKGGFRLGGVFSYQKAFDQEVFSNYLGTGVNIYRDVNTYAIGVQLSKKAGPVEPFGAFLLGFRKMHESLEYQVVRKYRAGVDVGLGHFVIRPFFVEFEAVGGFATGTTHKYGAGAGFRF